MPPRSGLLSRISGFFRPEQSTTAHSKNGHGFVAVDGVKAASLLPAFTGGVTRADFADFVPDGSGGTRDTAGGISLAFAAYWHVATHWRAQKIAEAPLMVVAEDQVDGSEEWIADHELAGALDAPSPDYDMGELLERTSRYLDNTGRALWVIDRDRIGRVARLTPFHGRQFEAKPGNDRLFAAFQVQTATGPVTYPADRVCFFRDDTGRWDAGMSRLDIAMHWLALAEKARTTIRDLLDNAIWPSLAAMPDKDWKPDAEARAAYKQELQSYARSGNKGKAFVMFGGGSMEVLSARIRDLVPTDVLNRVESVVAAISGVPAIVLQFQVGMENSPWSQMEQARRMAYDDTVQPAWRRIERVLTRQLLRPDDEDPTHFVRFDRSNVAALQDDRSQVAAIIPLVARIASVNERRMMMSLEPVSDPGADDIPELSAPAFSPFGATFDPSAQNTDPTANAKARNARRGRRPRAPRGTPSVLGRAFRDEAKAQWEHGARALLQHDASEIERIVRTTLTPTSKTGIEPNARQTAKVMAAIDIYLREEVSRLGGKWGQLAIQRMVQGAERAAATAAAEMGLSYTQLHAHVVEFAAREAGALITGIAETTRETVAGVIAKGLADGDAVADIARAVAESGAFASSRATLIAQTEATRASAGGPTEALAAYGKASGRTFAKRWSGVLDERERDEHIALEGETQFIGNPFTNGLQYPSEPNCRCQLVWSEVSDA